MTSESMELYLQNKSISQDSRDKVLLLSGPENV